MVSVFVRAPNFVSQQRRAARAYPKFYLDTTLHHLILKAHYDADITTQVLPKA